MVSRVPRGNANEINFSWCLETIKEINKYTTIL